MRSIRTAGQNVFVCKALNPRTGEPVKVKAGAGGSNAPSRTRMDGVHKTVRLKASPNLKKSV
jgi:hypothetical protein